MTKRESYRRGVDRLKYQGRRKRYLDVSLLLIQKSGRHLTGEGDTDIPGRHFQSLLSAVRPSTYKQTSGLQSILCLVVTVNSFKASSQTPYFISEISQEHGLQGFGLIIRLLPLTCQVLPEWTKRSKW